MLVVAAVIAREGRILACRRSRAGKFPLKWEFPGGKVHPNETPQAALERELQEELGITARVGPEIFRAQHKYAEMREPVDLIFFKAKIEAGEICNRVFETVEWLEPHKLVDLDFLEADRELTQKLAAGEILIRN